MCYSRCLTVQCNQIPYPSGTAELRVTSAIYILPLTSEARYMYNNLALYSNLRFGLHATTVLQKNCLLVLPYIWLETELKNGEFR